MDWDEIELTILEWACIIALLFFVAGVVMIAVTR